MSPDYIKIESLEGREKQIRAEAFYNAKYSSGSEFIEQCGQFLVCIVGVITSSLLIYKINIFMILLILLSCFGEFLLLKHLETKQIKNTDNYSTFAYLESDKITIKDMSFKINKGENGAEKTTASKLLCGFYYPSECDILINGKSSKEFSTDSYFHSLSAIFQNYRFLPMTIVENITVLQKYNKSKLYAALDKAGVMDKFILYPNKKTH